MLLIIIILIITCILIWKHLKNRERDVSQSYRSENAEYSIAGRKDNFSITKDGRYEFRVKNGDIVEVKDKKSHKKAVYGE